MCKNEFYGCEKCGNIALMLHNAGVPMMCCGQKMKKIEAGKIEAGHEKHIPLIKADGDKIMVDIGEIAHPMEDEHSILWVYLQTDKGGQYKRLAVGKPPVVTFALCDEKPICAYAYCNLHGLWKKDV